MKFLRYASMLMAVALVSVPVRAREPRTFEDLVMVRFNQFRDNNNLRVAARNFVRDLPFDILGLGQMSQVDLVMNKPLTTGAIKVVEDRLNVVEKLVAGARWFFANPQENILLVKSFVDVNYPMAAEQLLVQNAFDWLLSPNQAEWLNQVASVGLQAADRVENHVNGLRIALAEGTIAFRNEIDKSARALNSAIAQLDTIISSAINNPAHAQLIDLLTTAYTSLRQFNLQNPEFVAMKAQVAEQLRDLLQRVS